MRLIYFPPFFWGPSEEMDENKGEKQPQQHLSNSPADPHDQDSSDNTLPLQPQSVVSGAPYISSSSLYNIPGGTTAATATSVSFEQQQFEVVNPKRPRYTASQWKFISSSSSSHQQQQPPQQQHQKAGTILSAESSPISPSAHNTNIPQAQVPTASSSDTASSPSHSPRPSSEPSKSEGGEQVHQQFRKGKYVSPVWKPNEMLWLARAWKIQYQGGGGSSSELVHLEGVASAGGTAGGGRGKTRADKDREVAEFLNRHGVNRDAKTAGTKWDNMLGEFRKVYEWERGAEREQIGKSYFRLSPYERKIHRLPASFDEEVFEELSQFMGSRMRNPQTRIGTQPNIGDDSRTPLIGTRSLPPPPPLREDELPISGIHKNKKKNYLIFNLLLQ